MVKLLLLLTLSYFSQITMLQGSCCDSYPLRKIEGTRKPGRPIDRWKESNLLLGNHFHQCINLQAVCRDGMSSGKSQSVSHNRFTDNQGHQVMCWAQRYYLKRYCSCYETCVSLWEMPPSWIVVHRPQNCVPFLYCILFCIVTVSCVKLCSCSTAFTLRWVAVPVFVLHKVKTQYLHFRSHAEYFLLSW